MKAVLGGGCLGPRVFWGPRAFLCTTAKPDIRKRRLTTPLFPLGQSRAPGGDCCTSVMHIFIFIGSLMLIDGQEG